MRMKMLGSVSDVLKHTSILFFQSTVKFCSIELNYPDFKIILILVRERSLQVLLFGTR